MTQVANDGAQPHGGPPSRSDPREFFQLLLRHKWILLACVILIPLATYLVSTRLPKTYEASTVLQLQAVGGGQSLPGIGDLSGSGDTQTGDRVAALIQTNGVADQAARVLHEPVGSLRGSVTQPRASRRSQVRNPAPCSAHTRGGAARRCTKGSRKRD